MRRVKEGTSAVFLQSGLNESWWADSMECYTYLRNVTDLLSDGKTPYERRFGQPFKGPTIPFGSLVEYHPITAKDQSRIHQFGKKVLPGLFLGYALYAGGIWKGDVLIADLEELETMDASEIYSKRLNAKEVIFPKQGEFIFPIADGRIKTPGGDQELRTSTLIRPRPIQGEGHVDFLGESEGSLPQPHDSLPVAGEAIHDFWWPGGWGPQGRPETGGGGLARVPNLRVCDHPFYRWGWHTQGRKDELTSFRGTVKSAWQKHPVRRKGGRTGLPARVSARHVVRGRQSSPTLEVRLGEQARLVKTVKIQVSSAWTRPSAPGCGDTLKALAGDQRPI